VLLPQEKRSHKGEENWHCRFIAGGKAITPRVYEGSCVRPPDSGSCASPSGTEGEAMTLDILAGSVRTAEN
jgi:hypothetical protein